MTHYNFTEKIAVILGGTGGIGGAIADAFELDGAVVLRHGRKGGYKADLRNNGETNLLIKKILKQYGRIDILVNSVSAPVVNAPFERKRWSDFRAHLDIQLKSAVETAVRVLPIMKKNGGGRIVHILTTAIGGRTPPSVSDYITAKYALWGFTIALAKDVGKYNITVNAVSPSFVANRFSSRIPKKIHDVVIHDTPMGRLAIPDDVARAVLFLASDGAFFITGENIQISGGSAL